MDKVNDEWMISPIYSSSMNRIKTKRKNSEYKYLKYLNINFLELIMMKRILDVACHVSNSNLIFYIKPQ